MITLGVDPSLTGLGWCVHDGSVAGEGRVIAKGTFKTPADRIFYWRFMFLRDAVGRVLDRHPSVQAVGVESPPFGESYSEGLFGLFLYVNEAIMTRRKDVVYFDPLRVKLLAKMDSSVRQGTMDKSDIVEIAKQDTGIRRWNHNEADAYIIARSAARFWDLHADRIEPNDLTPAEEKVFRSVHVFTRGSKAGRTEQRGVMFKEGDRFYRFSTLTDEELALEIPTCASAAGPTTPTDAPAGAVLTPRRVSPRSTTGVRSGKA